MNKTETLSPSIAIHRITDDFPIADADNNCWKDSDPIVLQHYWSGADAPEGRHVSVRLLWSDSSIYIRFDADRTEPLVVNADPQTSTKTLQLWERDVCELFLAPDSRDPRRYYEFEIAPTGEWLDLIVDWSNAEPRDWEFSSGMEPFAKIGPDKVTMGMKIPWRAFGRKPAVGEVWAGNLFRQVGSGETRGYLAWSPTMTETPNFHVPERFGRLIFDN